MREGIVTGCSGPSGSAFTGFDGAGRLRAAAAGLICAPVVAVGVLVVVLVPLFRLAALAAVLVVLVMVGFLSVVVVRSGRDGRDERGQGFDVRRQVGELGAKGGAFGAILRGPQRVLRAGEVGAVGGELAHVGEGRGGLLAGGLAGHGRFLSG